jgi:hypothetical protein
MSEVTLLQKSLRILVDLIVCEPEKYLSKSSNILTALSRRISQGSNYSRGISLIQKCAIIHTSIINSLMKNGNSALTETIKAILGDFQELLRMRFSFK